MPDIIIEKNGRFKVWQVTEKVNCWMRRKIFIGSYKTREAAERVIEGRKR